MQGFHKRLCWVLFCLFSVYTNDLPLCTSSADVDCDLLADDSALTAAEKNVAANQHKVSDWGSANMM